MNMASPVKKIGLALGSGAVRGWAHMGVIQAMEELGVPIHLVAGTSMGSLVGAFHVTGKLEVLRNLSHELDWRQALYFFDVTLPKSGLIDGQKIKEFIDRSVGDIKIEELESPFRAVATDLVTGREVVIDKGDIIEAVRASISVPGIFTPVRLGEMLLVDGGLVNPVPVSVARAMGADIVIAVDLNHDIQEKRRHIRLTPNKDKNSAGHAAGQRNHRKNRIWQMLESRMEELDLSLPEHFERWTAQDNMPGILDVMLKSLDILEAQVAETRLKLDPPDVIIRPMLGHLKLLEFGRAEEAIEAGYTEAMKALRESGIAPH